MQPNKSRHQKPHQKHCKCVYVSFSLFSFALFQPKNKRIKLCRMYRKCAVSKYNLHRTKLLNDLMTAILCTFWLLIFLPFTFFILCLWPFVRMYFSFALSSQFSGRWCRVHSFCCCIVSPSFHSYFSHMERNWFWRIGAIMCRQRQNSHRINVTTNFRSFYKHISR